MRLVSALALSVLALAASVHPGALRAQEPPAPAQPADIHSLPPDTVPQLLAQPGGSERVDIITPHITDGRYVYIPHWRPPFQQRVYLPQWEPVHIGGVAIDVSPTRHVVFLIVAAVLTIVTLVGAAVFSGRQTRTVGHPRGIAAAIEAVVLYLRSEVALPNLGKGGERYVPFILTLFFFILFANLLGLMPYGATATGNISVTATLAIITFIMIEIAGMRALGWHYIQTIVFWPSGMSLAIKLPMTLIMTPVEIIGKFTKPFALAIRLFANMTAGHIILLAIIGLIFSFAAQGGAAAGVAVAPVIMAIAINVLEIFVAFLQAFIFALLASVFIGQIRESHH